jgi:hypothetical protein
MYKWYNQEEKTMKKYGNFGKKHYARQYAWKQANYTGH